MGYDDWVAFKAACQSGAAEGASATAVQHGVETSGAKTAAGKPMTPPGGSKKKFSPGSTVVHPKYGRGTVLRREGEGDDTKLTISFPGYGLKKIVQKFAGIQE